MAYASKQDIIDLYGDKFLLIIAARGDEESLDEPLTSEAINDALAHASSEADTYISRNDSVPVMRPPRVLQIAVINAACHHLASTADSMTEIIRERYEDALKWYINLSKGVAKLPPGENDQGETIAEASPQAIMVQSAKPMFKRDS